MRLLFPIAAITLAALPADMAGAGSSTPVLEIVNFRLVDGANEVEFLAAAQNTEAMLRDEGGLIRRFLGKDEQGVWTDVVEWKSMQAAKAAAEAVTTHPDFAPFSSMIAPDSVEMRHATIRWRLD